MSEVFADYGVFLLKTLTVLVAALIVVRAMARVRGGRDRSTGRLLVARLDEALEQLADAIRAETTPRKARREVGKARRKARKARDKGQAESRPTVWVLRFDGDIRATAVASLRREVTALCQVASEGDEVLVRLKSGGGVVHSYGLAAAQLERLRERGLRLVVAVDEIAASGGYMMAVVAHHIVAAPFAILGSIGVVATLPNVNRALKKRDVDIELHTAGQHKRTLTVLGENTEEGREKFREQLEDVHGLFKAFVGRYRPDLDLEAVATGEHWYGTRALELGLADELLTSDDYLLRRLGEADLVAVKWEPKRTFGRRLGRFAAALGREVTEAGLQAAEERRFP